MNLSVEEVGDVVVVTPAIDRLEAGNAESFKQSMLPIQEKHQKIVLDLHRIEFIDSSGCGTILSSLKHLHAQGGDLKICAPTTQVKQVFSLIRLHKLCDILDTREEAVATFSA